MAYTKQSFSDNQVLTADNMNHIEDGLEGAHLGLSDKQDVLVSGTNIKTINGVSILGEGDLVIQSGASDTAPVFTSDYIQVVDNEISSINIPESVKSSSFIVYHNGSFLVSGLHYTIEEDMIVFNGFNAFKDDVFSFVTVGK